MVVLQKKMDHCHVQIVCMSSSCPTPLIPFNCRCFVFFSRLHRKPSSLRSGRVSSNIMICIENVHMDMQATFCYRIGIGAGPDWGWLTHNAQIGHEYGSQRTPNGYNLLHVDNKDEGLWFCFFFFFFFIIIFLYGFRCIACHSSTYLVSDNRVFQTYSYTFFLHTTYRVHVNGFCYPSKRLRIRFVYAYVGQFRVCICAWSPDWYAMKHV